MTSVNLRPIQKDDRPTSHVRVGRSKVGGETDVVRVQHRDREAYFRAETENDRVMDTVGSKAYIHENVADVFGGISYDDRFMIDGDASEAAVPAADELVIYPRDVAPDVLEEFLREQGFFVHRIEEVAEVRGSLVKFMINEMKPSAYSTLRVTDDTEIEFADKPVEPQVAQGIGPGPAGSAGNGPASASRQRGEQSEERAAVSVEPTVPNISFEDDVAGLKEVKETAQMLLALFDIEIRSQIINMYGEEFADRGGSMLLYGPPGCGKTHVSEAIAYEAKHKTGIEDQYGEVVFLEVRGSDIQSKYAGESEKNVSDVFNQAHRIAKEEGFAVLFFDEIETLIPDRSDDNLQRHERAVTNAFLQEMNNIEDNLFVIGATNMPFTIDPAATRRFPIQQFIEQPGEQVMSEVWRKQLSSLPNANQIDFDRLGEASVGYTPAEIADRILGSDLQRKLIRSVIDGDPREVTTEYLLERLEETEPKTVRQYVASVRDQLNDLDGYPEMSDYIHKQADELGIDLHSNTSGPISSLLTDTDHIEQRRDASDKSRPASNDNISPEAVSRRDNSSDSGDGHKGTQ